ncbi:MAG: hypothetical protein ACQETR_09240 [Thermodesulfobacteriota bacterium]
MPGIHSDWEEIRPKYEHLQTILMDIKEGLVIFSGGTDSTFLLKVAKNVLKEKVLAVTALLCMLNSCASGVSVVNIDNGFGAGLQVNLINKLAVKHLPDEKNSTKNAHCIPGAA